MALDIRAEKLLTEHECIGTLPECQVQAGTVNRGIKQGCCEVQMPAVCVGARMFVSQKNGRDITRDGHEFPTPNGWRVVRNLSEEPQTVRDIVKQRFFELRDGNSHSTKREALDAATRYWKKGLDDAKNDAELAAKLPLDVRETVATRADGKRRIASRALEICKQAIAKQERLGSV